MSTNQSSQSSVIDRICDAIKETDPEDPDPTLSLIKREEAKPEPDKTWLEILRRIHKSEFL